MPTPLTMGPNVRTEDGLWIQDAEAPSLKTLRPLTPAEPGVFPVYDHLTDKLVHPTDPLRPGVPQPDRVVARTLATAAGYAYSDAATVSTMMARMGLEGNRCRMIATYVDAMFIASTAYLIQSASGRVVILAYRGTQPTGLISWLADADLARSRISLSVDGAPCDVHGGFYRNARATRYKITEALLRAKRGLPITAPKGVTQPGPDTPALQPMEALYITGHSLGGAIAAIETILLKTDPKQDAALGDAFKATYTFGQPMIGSPELAQGCDAIPALRDNLIRFVYRKDPVPHVPPRDAGPFAHFGREYAFDRGAWAPRLRRSEQMHGIVGLLSSGLSFLTGRISALHALSMGYQIDDHAPQHYIEALTPPGGLTEFGDHTYSNARP